MLWPFVIVSQENLQSVVLKDANTGVLVDEGKNIPLDQILAAPRRNRLLFDCGDDDGDPGPRSLGQMLRGEHAPELAPGRVVKKPGQRAGWGNLTKGSYVVYRTGPTRELRVGRVLKNERPENRVLLHAHRGRFQGFRVIHLPEYREAGAITLTTTDDLHQALTLYSALIMTVELLVGGEINHSGTRSLSNNGWSLEVTTDEIVAAFRILRGDPSPPQQDRENLESNPQPSTAPTRSKAQGLLKEPAPLQAKRPGCALARVFEIWTWTEIVTTTAEDHPDWIGLAPISIETGYDLLTQDGVSRARDKILLEDPDLVVLAFPCAPWSVLQHLQNAEVKAANRDRQAKHRPFLEFAEEVAQHQMAKGKYFVLENPAASAAFREAPLVELASRDGVGSAKFDMCTQELREPESGLPLKKSTRLLSNSPAIIAHFRSQQCTCTSSHARILGSTRVPTTVGTNGQQRFRSVNLSEFAGGYTAAFSAKILDLALIDIREDSYPRFFRRLLGQATSVTPATRPDLPATCNALAHSAEPSQIQHYKTLTGQSNLAQGRSPAAASPLSSAIEIGRISDWENAAPIRVNHFSEACSEASPCDKITRVGEEAVPRSASELNTQRWMDKLSAGDLSGPTFPVSQYLELRGRKIEGNPRQTTEYSDRCWPGVSAR